jgi:hypothetical protein
MSERGRAFCTTSVSTEKTIPIPMPATAIDTVASSRLVERDIRESKRMPKPITILPTIVTA